jgi:beta-lactamase regulating signal transducer with metallopeptidase domain
MISTINEAAVALGRMVELSILGKATIILVIGLTIVMLSRRARASVRHLLLAATLAAVLVLPLIVWAVPELTIGVPASQAIESTDLGPAAPQVAPIAPTGASLPSRATESARWSLPSWIAIFRSVWLTGAFLLLALLAVDLRRLYRIRRDGLPWLERRDLVRSLAGECGLRRKVEVLLHEGISGPLTFGIWRPAILLPAEACEWNEADLRRALVHELEHVRRGDWAIQLAARATCVFYWFHPLVWVALRRLVLEAERAADDAVVRSADHAEYADQLVSLAGRISRSQAQTALGMANRSDLSARVSALLDDSQRRGRAGWRPTASVLSVASLVALTLAPVRAVTLPGKQTAASAQAPDSQIKETGKLVQFAKNSEAAWLERKLIRAVADGDLEAVRQLLDRGADPNLWFGGNLPLSKAAELGHVEIVSLLLDRGATIDQIVQPYGNALIRSSAKGHLEVVKLLVARGADVNALAWSSQTVQFLNEKGKIVTAKVRVGEFIRKKDGTTEIRETVDSPPKAGEWRTPLLMAKRGGHKEVVDFLIASGARQ